MAIIINSWILSYTSRNKFIKFFSFSPLVIVIHALHLLNPEKLHSHRLASRWKDWLPSQTWLLTSHVGYLMWLLTQGLALEMMAHQWEGPYVSQENG